MSDNNTNVDTQNQDPQYESLEEAVFGGNNDGPAVDSAFTETTGQEDTKPAPQGQPVVNNEGNSDTLEPANNDETRYQYWQSQADKYKNELEKTQSQQQQFTPQQQLQQQQAPVQEPQVEAFPEAPLKPSRPSAFNREEAYSDPSSISARYLDEVESWRDDISEYNSLKSQYQTALIEERLDKQDRRRVDEIKRRQAHMEVKKQENEILTHVKGHYGMSENDAVNFVKTMSNPSSITVDNLVQLYRMKSGGTAPQQSAAPTTPSQTFIQTKNAQQVPSPMGVMPSGHTNAETSSFNSKNPWK